VPQIPFFMNIKILTKAISLLILLHYLMVSRGARIALVIAPARAPLINSRTSLLSKKSCTKTKIINN
jgi:hypothetical protein